jgi:hypothetical protein
MLVGVAVGMIGILMVWYCFAKHWDLVLRPELFVLHLSVVIGIVYVLFAFAIGRKDKQSDASCTAVAGVLHYFLLTTWSWQMCEAEHLYHTFVYGAQCCWVMLCFDNAFGYNTCWVECSINVSQ